MKKLRPKLYFSQGALLLELLLVISVLAVILSVSSQAVFVSVQSGKLSAERDSMSDLAIETLEAVRGVVDEDWQNIYTLTKGSTHYRPVISGDAWTLVPGDEVVTLHGISYTRYVVINNVSRDTTADHNIEEIYNATNDDPSTQEVTVAVLATSTAPLLINDYFYRWNNRTCVQTDWSTGPTVPADPQAGSCATARYYSDDGHVNATSSPGSFLLN